MAKGKYQKLYEARMKRLGKDKNTSDDLQRQINNYKARLEAGGVENPDTDDRNALEKWLNLEQDQNVVFDIFELLERPIFQPLKTGISNAQKGESFIEGALDGFTGKKKTDFKEILTNAGMDDPNTVEELVRNGETFDFKNHPFKTIGTAIKAIDPVDVMGMAGEMFLDPSDWALIPLHIATGGATLAADKAADVAKVAKAADKAADVAKAADKASDIAKAADKAADVAKVAKPVKYVSVNDLLFEGAGKLAKGGAKLADTGIEKGLEYIDKAKGTIYANPTAKWASELGKIGDGTNLLERYKGIKNNLTTMFSTKLSKTARKSKKINDAIEHNVRVYLENKAEGLNNMVESVAKKLGKSADEVAKDIQKITDKVDNISLLDVIEGAKNGTIKYSDDIVNALNTIADDIPQVSDLLKKGITKADNGALQLSEEWLSNLDNLDIDRLSNLKVKRASWLSDDELKKIDDLTKYYNDNAPELVEAFNSFYTDANDYIAKNFSSMSELGEKFNLKNAGGYSKHKLSDNYVKNLQKLVKDYGVDPSVLENQIVKEGFSSTGAATLNARKYNMSAAEANLLKKQELMSIPGLPDSAKKFIEEEIDLFDTMATAGVQEYINNMPKYAKNTQMIDEILIKQGFGDIDEINRLNSIIKSSTGAEKLNAQTALNKLLDNSPFRVVDSGKAPYGFKKLEGETKNYLVNFLNSTGKKTGNKSLIDMSEKLKKLDNMTIDPTVLTILKVSTDTTKKSEILKMYDSSMNFFKGAKTFSLTNQMNNITGNISNMMLSGMSGADVSKYTSKAFSELYGKGGYEEILKKGITDITQLSPKEREIFERIQLFEKSVSLLDDAALAEKYDIGDIAGVIKGKTTPDKLKYLAGSMARLNGAEDRLFKYALFLKGMDDPKYLANLGIEIGDDISKASAEAVSKVLFDPRDLTDFENKVMKRLIPFYTFTKKNLAFQFENLGKNGIKYRRLMKGYNNLTSNEGFDNVADYLKENMYIPIPIIDKNGNYKFIRAQLPFGDFISTVEDPIGTLVNSSTPLFKTPYELATGIDTFTGREIESFPGEKSKQLPFMTKKTENLLGDLTGLDVPLKLGYNLFKGSDNEDTGMLGNLGQNLLDMTTISGNVDTDKINRQYEEIEELQNLMKQYEQEGYEFSTMTELKKANKNGTVAGLNSIFAKYGIDQKTYKNH